MMIATIRVAFYSPNRCLGVRFINHSGPLSLLKSKVSAGELQHDPKQFALCQNLERLYKDTLTYAPNHRKSIWDRFRANQSAGAIRGPKGIYIYGAVGGGKTMLMDLFYECCTHIQAKTRIHFHEFMVDVHGRTHALKMEDRESTSDPMPPIADTISQQSWLICFDEFQVTDIADAMILKRLFTLLFERGTVIVATSNRSPDHLYLNGLQRANFLPFIPLLKKYCEIAALDTGRDYRQRMQQTAKSSYFVIKDYPDSDPVLPLLKFLCSKENDVMRSRTLSILGRNVHFARACGGILDSTFQELCDRPLGANDYLHLTQFFHTIVIRDVPQLTLRMRSQARRFITLIDALYDHRTKVIVTAHVPIKELFSKQKPSNDEISDEHRMLMDDLKIGKQEAEQTNLFTGDEELFAFDRTISRLTQMQTDKYWQEKSR